MHSSIWNSVMPFSSVGQIGGSYNQRSDSFRRDLKDNQNNTYSDGINTITRHRYGYQNNSGKQYTRDERGKKHLEPDPDPPSYLKKILSIVVVSISCILQLIEE